MNPEVSLTLLTYFVTVKLLNVVRMGQDSKSTNEKSQNSNKELTIFSVHTKYTRTYFIFDTEFYYYYRFDNAYCSVR